jgi:hypothetical protein
MQEKMKTNLQNQFLATLFPEIQIYTRKLHVWPKILILVLLTLLFSLIGAFWRADGFVGFDWVNFFGQGRIAPFYPPWVKWIVAPLTWPLLIGLTLAATSMAAYLRSTHPINIIPVFLCLPLFWTLFLGQLEGLVVLGLLGLPWLAPIALVKPQVSIFAFGAKWKYLIAFFLLLGISILIWGFWPKTLLSAESFYAEGRYQQNIGLGWWGLPVTLATVWFSRGDMDMLMASGVFMIPHLIPYNLLPLVPAVARLRPRAAWLAAIFSWLPWTANWLGPRGWWLGWLFVFWIWINLAASRYPNFVLSQWLIKAGGDKFIPAHEKKS